MLFTRKATAIWLFFAFERVLTAQIPLPGLSFDFGHDSCDGDLGQWDLDKPPAANATGNLVFETANSLLQHWPNTRYRIGTERLHRKCRDSSSTPRRSYNNPRDYARGHSLLPWIHQRSPYTDRSRLGRDRARPLHDFLQGIGQNWLLAPHPCSHSADESALF